MAQRLNVRRVHTIVKNRVIGRNPYMRLSLGSAGDFWIQAGQVYGGEDSEPMLLDDIPQIFWDHVENNCSDDALAEVGFLRPFLEFKLGKENVEKVQEELKEEMTGPEEAPAKAAKQEEVTDGDNSAPTRKSKPRNNKSDVDGDNGS